MEPENPQNKTEQVAEKITQELHINLPGENSPLLIRIIAFFTLIGGLSIIGSLFADIVNTSEKAAHMYLVRLIVGLSSVAISYGLIEKKRWAIWIYGFLVLIGLFINPLVTLFPAVVVGYLITKKNNFSPSVFDYLLRQAITRIRKIFYKKPTDYM